MDVVSKARDLAYNEKSSLDDLLELYGKNKQNPTIARYLEPQIKAHLGLEYIPGPHDNITPEQHMAALKILTREPSLRAFSKRVKDISVQAITSGEHALFRALFDETMVRGCFDMVGGEVSVVVNINTFKMTNFLGTSFYFKERFDCMEFYLTPALINFCKDGSFKSISEDRTIRKPQFCDMSKGISPKTKSECAKMIDNLEYFDMGFEG